MTISNSVHEHQTSAQFSSRTQGTQATMTPPTKQPVLPTAKSEAQPTNYRIRQATKEDIPRLVDIICRAFADEPLFAQWYPLKDMYPEDLLRIALMTGRAAADWSNPERRTFVLEVEVGKKTGAQKKKQRRVVAFADFSVYGFGEERDLAKRRPISPRRLGPKRDNGPESSGFDMYREQAAKIYDQHLEKPMAQQKCIYGHKLAVDPAYQGRGYGKKLVEWLAQAAWAANVPVYGEVTAPGLPLYLKHGCEVLGKIQLPEMFVSAPGGKGKVKVPGVEATVLKWTPRNMKA